MKFLLYGTHGCHLCDEAKTLVENAKRMHAFDYDYVDILDDQNMLDRFETSIPVLLDPYSDEMLFWPFAGSDLEQFILSSLMNKKKPA